MGIVLAVIFFVLAIVSLVAYGGTPHGGPTSSCGPIVIFGNHYTLNGDCRYISIAELAAGGLFLFLSLLAALSARPRR